MIETRRIEFPSHGCRCSADLHLPERGVGPDSNRDGGAPTEEGHRDEDRAKEGARSDGTESEGRRRPGEGRIPVVVMAHGLGAERTQGLAPFVREFVARGLAVLAFDYRHLGESEGSPRRLVSSRRQVEDYHAALAFARDHPALDPARIGLWGTSFSGGHVLTVAAARPQGVKAVVSQIPFVSGWASTMAYPLRYHLPAIALGLTDRLGSWLGREPLTVPLVSASGMAVLASPDSEPGYRRMMGPDAPPPEPLAARVFLDILTYHPGRKTPRVQVPTLVVLAEDDAICPPRATRRAASRLPQGELISFPMGHFDPYVEPWFQEAVAVEADFLVKHLAPGVGSHN
jgi:quorum-quenching protein AidA